jgi:hypothetical protein
VRSRRPLAQGPSASVSAATREGAGSGRAATPQALARATRCAWDESVPCRRA